MALFWQWKPCRLRPIATRRYSIVIFAVATISALLTRQRRFTVTGRQYGVMQFVLRNTKAKAHSTISGRMDEAEGWPETAPLMDKRAGLRHKVDALDASPFGWRYIGALEYHSSITTNGYGLLMALHDHDVYLPGDGIAKPIGGVNPCCHRLLHEIIVFKRPGDGFQSWREYRSSQQPATSADGGRTDPFERFTGRLKLCQLLNTATQSVIRHL